MIFKNKNKPEKNKEINLYTVITSKNNENNDLTKSIKNKDKELKKPEKNIFKNIFNLQIAEIKRKFESFSWNLSFDDVISGKTFIKRYDKSGEDINQKLKKEVLHNPSGRYAILNKAASGKSVLLYKLLFEIGMNKKLKPIFLSLTEVTENDELSKEFILKQISQKYYFSLKIKEKSLFNFLNKYNYVFILDSLDENTTFNPNNDGLVKLFNKLKDPAEQLNSYVIACRDNYFDTRNVHVTRALFSRIEPLKLTSEDIKNFALNFCNNSVHLKDFKDRIAAFVADTKEKYTDELVFSNLLLLPRFLQYLEDLQINANPTKLDSIFNRKSRSDILSVCLKDAINLEIDKKNLRLLNIDDNLVDRLFEETGEYVFLESFYKHKVNYNSLLEHLKNHFDVDKTIIDNLLELIILRERIDTDRCKFNYESFLEFYVAKRTVNIMLSNHDDKHDKIMKTHFKPEVYWYIFGLLNNDDYKEKAVNWLIDKIKLSIEEINKEKRLIENSIIISKSIILIARTSTDSAIDFLKKILENGNDILPFVKICLYENLIQYSGETSQRIEYEKTYYELLKAESKFCKIAVGTRLAYYLRPEDNQMQEQVKDLLFRGDSGDANPVYLWTSTRTNFQKDVKFRDIHYFSRRIELIVLKNIIEKRKNLISGDKNKNYMQSIERFKDHLLKMKNSVNQIDYTFYFDDSDELIKKFNDDTINEINEFINYINGIVKTNN